MTEFGTPLPAAERDALLERLAEGIARRGLEVPALFALEVHRPLAGTLAHGLIGLTPLLGPVLGAERLTAAARLLAEPGAIDDLMARLERREVGTAA